MVQGVGFKRENCTSVPNELWIVPIGNHARCVWGYLNSVDFQPSLYDMKIDCKWSIGAVRKSIKILVDRKMILADISMGGSTYITLDASLWEME